MAASLLTAGPLRFDLAVYSEDCIREALAAYGPFFEATITNVPGAVSVALVPRRADIEEVAARREFLNYVLDLTLKHHLHRV